MASIIWEYFYNASVLKHKKRKYISTSQRHHDQSCLFNCKDVKTLLSALKDNFRSSFFIDVDKILQSAFECIEADSLFKSDIKKLPLMEVALLASMSIEFGFDHGPSMNGINNQIVCRC